MNYVVTDRNALTVRRLDTAAAAGQAPTEGFCNCKVHALPDITGQS
jgi:hypothetical protein